MNDTTPKPSIQPYDETFFTLRETLRNAVASDGFQLAVYDHETNLYTLLSSDMQWREYDILPESLLKEAFAKQKPLRIEDIRQSRTFHADIDAAGDKKAGSMLLYPFKEDSGRYTAVYVLWRHFETEKDQILQPLVVGNQMVGMTTRAQHTIVKKSFDKEEEKHVASLTAKLHPYVTELMAHIAKSKEALLEDIKEDETLFGTPQEIIASLIHMLTGLNRSVTNLQDIIAQLKKRIHKDDAAASYIGTLEAIATSMQERLEHTVAFTSTHEIVRSLLEGHAEVETVPFFSYFFTSKKAYACDKHLSVNLFLDPRTPAKLTLDKAALFAFMQAMTDLLFNEAEANTPFYMFIYTHPESRRLIIKTMLYTPQEPSALTHLKQEAFEMTYRRFRKAGGDVTTHYDPTTRLATYKATLGYTNAASLPVAPSLADRSFRIGFLLSKTRDLDTANNLTRYLMAMGVKKEALSAGESPGFVTPELTHLIVFESRFDALAEALDLRSLGCKILLVTDGCLQKGVTRFYDFSVIDAEIEKNSLYLDDLIDFLTLEV